MFYKQSHGKEIILCHGFSFSLKFPLLSTIPNLLPTFSVHLMNCYFHDFWYSHVTEKRTSEGRNAIYERSRTSLCEKRDISKYRLSQLSEISPSSLGRIMAQENLPSLITLEKICTALGVTLSQF